MPHRSRWWVWVTQLVTLPLSFLCFMIIGLPPWLITSLVTAEAASALWSEWRYHQRRQRLAYLWQLADGLALDAAALEPLMPQYGIQDLAASRRGDFFPADRAVLAATQALEQRISARR